MSSVVLQDLDYIRLEKNTFNDNIDVKLT